MMMCGVRKYAHTTEFYSQSEQNQRIIAHLIRRLRFHSVQQITLGTQCNTATGIMTTDCSEKPKITESPLRVSLV